MGRSYYYLVGILVVFILIQFIRPKKNDGIQETPEDFIQISEVPDTLARVFMNSCYDCHSNLTGYPWYGNIAPFSWYMNSHIKEGKEHLNFSEWGLLGKPQKISRLDDICTECSGGAMPLKSYLFIHRSAELSPHEIAAICQWAEEESIRIMDAGE